ncbi:WxcM-like, C-terminal [Pseudomonas sp. NFACC23-1]|nr:WxcM-like, C-terminal [Pseudomonas sp. NFACC17-2]SEI96272.1 WxcM-like, C-terminal [Pseudomonas sp. NFACC23-1]SFW33329.1 WxcM-like, C-terminal [Pseudomonas sp. NFACC16-2]
MPISEFVGGQLSLIKWIDFQSLGDERGDLVALEIGLEKAIPFDVKRVYYIYRTAEGVSRGFHAHQNLKQIAICVAGKFRMVLDDGHTREEAWMDNPTKGLLIESMVWREMHDFSSDCVLLVLASEHYDEYDYIRDYQEFLKLVD